MLHYHAWFDFRPGIVEPHAIQLLQEFLSQLLAEGKIAAFRLLKNTAAKPDTILAAYQALIEFDDDAHFAAAFQDLRGLGIHTGPHGEIIEIVASFSAEVFKEVS